MSFKFSHSSMKNLAECHPDLQRLFHKVIEVIDCSIIDGHRGQEEQNKLFHAKRSKLEYPKSKHNLKPSLAVDVVPSPVDWEDVRSFYYLAGVIKAVAHGLGIKIRLGADWDGDNSFTDQTFHDLPHVELIIDEN